MKYVQMQNVLIHLAQQLFDKEDRVDAVTYDGKDFIVFINTHASSRPQMVHYVSPGAIGYNEMKQVIDSN